MLQKMFVRFARKNYTEDKGEEGGSNNSAVLRNLFFILIRLICIL